MYSCLITLTHFRSYKASGASGNLIANAPVSDIADNGASGSEDETSSDGRMNLLFVNLTSFI